METRIVAPSAFPGRPRRPKARRYDDRCSSLDRLSCLNFRFRGRSCAVLSSLQQHRQNNPFRDESESDAPPREACATNPERGCVQSAKTFDISIFGIGKRSFGPLTALQKVYEGVACCWGLDVDGTPDAPDVEKNTLGFQVVRVHPENEHSGMPIRPSVMDRLVGAYPGDKREHRSGAERATTHGVVYNERVTTNTGALAFVLAPASSLPGGSDTVFQLLHHLRAAGYFTVAVVTRPFAFEGKVKRAQAQKIIESLKEEKGAHVVSVVEQEVLLQAFGGGTGAKSKSQKEEEERGQQLTVAEAMHFSDTAVEHTVRSIVQAVEANEVLKYSQGALMWHGERDMNRFKRLISPPLQSLLAHASGPKKTAVLGRGKAEIPVSTLGDIEDPQRALLYLASDAVHAATESPFLDGVLEGAHGIICCLQIPNPTIKKCVGTRGVGVESPESAEHSLRMACQAAAGALRSLSPCEDFVLCADIVDHAERRMGEHDALSTLSVEATVLVLRSASDENSAAMLTARERPSPAESGGASSLLLDREGSLHSSASEDDSDRTRSGVADARQGSEATGNTSSRKLPASSWTMLSAMAGGTTKNSRKEATLPRKEIKPSPPVIRKNPIQKKSTVDAGVEEELVVEDSLTAQSLDLPPAAALWRVRQRPEWYRQRRLIVWQVDETEPWEHEVEETGIKALFLGKKKRKEVDIKKRMTGILEQDREDLWEMRVREAEEKRKKKENES